MFRTASTRVALAALALASLAWQGCSTEDMLTAPGADRPGLETAVRRTPVSDGTWTVVASDKIIPGQEMTLSGSRYTLHFTQNAVHNAMVISVSERDRNIVDVKLDPDGSLFDEQVTLVIDYAGTSNDPDAPYYTGMAPKVGRFNAATQTWDAIPGVDDAFAKTFTVVLTGFSRYAMNDGMQSNPGITNSDHTKTIR